MEKLIVPVYLNQRLVFDLLAMLQGGISTVTTVSRTESAEVQAAESVSTNFGLSGALSSLLKIDLSGQKNSGENRGHENKSSEERVHTPASLLYELRENLYSRGMISEITDAALPKSGDLVEFEASLKRNPVVETMDALSSMMEMAILFQDDAGNSKKGEPKSKGTEYQKTKKQMEAFLEGLKAGNTIDLTAGKLASKYEALLTLERQYLNDPAMSDLVDGKFYVLGKVIRSVESPSENISLLRKTALSRLPEPMLQQLFGHLSALSVVQGFSLPPLRLEICGPAFQVIPIAVYA